MDGSTVSGNHQEIDRKVYEAKKNQNGGFKEMIRQLQRAFALAKIPFLCEWGVFTVTFICFPGLCFGMNLSFLSTIPAWMPIIVIIIFNICDTIGRQMGGMSFARVFGEKQVLLLVLSRLIFLVFLFLFNAQLGPAWLLGD